MTKTLYVVQYNDQYANGRDKKLEVIVESYEDFLKWLEYHNESRRLDCIDDDDYCKEEQDEFTLIPLALYVSENNN